MSHPFPLPRNVYILGDGLLFDEIIAHMLASANDLRVFKRIYRDEFVFLTDVREFNPNVIFLNESAQFNCEQLIVMLSQTPLRSNVRIITLSLSHEKIRILDQPAGQVGARANTLQTINRIKNRNELLDLVAGRQLPRESILQ